MWLLGQSVTPRLHMTTNFEVQQSASKILHTP